MRIKQGNAQINTQETAILTEFPHNRTEFPHNKTEFPHN